VAVGTATNNFETLTSSELHCGCNIVAARHVLRYTMASRARHCTIDDTAPLIMYSSLLMAAALC